MKFHHSNPKSAFQPVTIQIVFESQDELNSVAAFFDGQTGDLIRQALVNGTAQNYKESAVNVFVSNFYNKVVAYCGDR